MKWDKQVFFKIFLLFRALVKQRRNTHCSHQSYPRVYEEVRRDANLNKSIVSCYCRPSEKEVCNGTSSRLQHWLRLIQGQPELCIQHLKCPRISCPIGFELIPSSIKQPLGWSFKLSCLSGVGSPHVQPTYKCSF